MLKNRLLVYISFTTLLLVSIYGITLLKFDKNTNNFTAHKDAESIFYSEYINKFSSDQSSIMLAIPSTNGSLNKEFIREIASLSEVLDTIKEITHIESIATVKDFVKSPLGIVSFPIVDLESDHKISEKKITNDPRLYGWLVSKDLMSANMLLTLRDDLSYDEKDAFIVILDSLIKLHSKRDIRIAGDINTNVRFVRMLEEQTFRGIIYTTIVAILFLFLFYRSVAGIIVPILSVWLGMIYLYGYLGFIDRPITRISSLFPGIMLIVGMSDIIHFISKYRDGLRLGFKKNVALKAAIRELRITLFLTSLTTAIGFISLANSPIKELSDFGLDVTIGIAAAFLIAVILLPSILSLLPDPRVSNRNSDKVFISILEAINNHVLDKPLRIILAFAAVAVIAIYGITKVDSNSFLLNHISEETKLIQDLKYFENNFNGVRSFEISIKPKNNRTIFDSEVLSEIDKVEKHLRSIKEIGNLFSPATLIKSCNKANKGFSMKNYSLPSTENDHKKSISLLSKFSPKVLRKVATKDRQEGRITSRMKDMGRVRATALNDSIRDWIVHNINPSIVEFRLTGKALVEDSLNTSLISSMFQSLGIALILITIIMALMFKNIKMILVSLIPNLFPLIIIGALIGYLNIPLDSSLAVIFTIGFVIAVDDTIHFLSKYNIAIKNELNVAKAINTTIHETGKPIILTSLLLFFGFAVLLVSPFKGAYYTGLLLSITIITAVLSDLLLMPSLIILMFKPNIKQNEADKNILVKE